MPRSLDVQTRPLHRTARPRPYCAKTGSFPVRRGSSHTLRAAPCVHLVLLHFAVQNTYHHIVSHIWHASGIAVHRWGRRCEYRHVKLTALRSPYSGTAMREENSVHPQGVQPWGNYFLSGKKHVRSSGTLCALQLIQPEITHSSLQNYAITYLTLDPDSQDWAVSGTWTTSCCCRFCSSLMPGPSPFALQPAGHCTASACMTSSGEP